MVAASNLYRFIAVAVAAVFALSACGPSETSATSTTSATPATSESTSAPTSATTATHSQVPSGTTPAEVTPTTVQTPVAPSTSTRPSMSPTIVSTASWDSSLDVKTKPFNGWVIKLPVGSRLVSSRVGESKATHDLYLLPDGRHLEVVSLTSTFTYDKWADSIYAKYAVSDLTNFYEDFTWCDGMVNGHGEAYILGKNVAVGEADYGKFYAYSTANEASNAVVIEYGVDGHSSWLLKSIFGAERTEEY